MKNKIIGIGICIAMLLTCVPLVDSLDTIPRTEPPSPSNELRKAFIIGRYSNLTGQGGYINVVTANMFVIYQDPKSFAHFPRGTQLKFDMYSAYGHIFKKVQFLYLHVELVV